MKSDCKFFSYHPWFFAAANVFRSCRDRFRRVIDELREITFVDFKIIFGDFYGTCPGVKISILSGLSPIYVLYMYMQT